MWTKTEKHWWQGWGKRERAYLSIRTLLLKCRREREQSIREICDNKKWYIHTMRIQKGERTEICEGKTAGNFSKLTINTKLQIQETLRTPSTTNTTISTSRRITLKLQRTRDKENLERGQREELETISVSVNTSYNWMLWCYFNRNITNKPWGSMG